MSKYGWDDPNFQEEYDPYAQDNQPQQSVWSPNPPSAPQPGPGGGAPTQYGGTADTNPGPYGAVGGYDYGKLSDATHRGSGKYNNDVGLYSQALGALNYTPESGFTPSEATLGELTNWMNAHGGNVSRSGDKMKFLNSLDANGNPYEIDIATDYNPEGGHGGFSFQDPRGNPEYDISTGTWQHNTAGGGGAPGGIPGMGGPGGSGPGGDDSWITGGLQDVFKRSLDTINKPVGSAQFEALRNPIDKARRTAGNQNSAELASRGMLSGSGEALNAAGRTEEKLAPAFATAVQNASVENTNNAFKNALGALQGGTQHKQVAGQLALGQLDQNRQWNQFLGDFGLRRAQVEDMINSGHIDQLLEYFKTWSNGNMGG